MKVTHNKLGEEPIRKKDSEQESKIYSVLEKLPPPERKFNLTRDQKKWWYWFGYEFVETRKFSKLDLFHLQNAAVSLDQRNKIIQKINKLNQEDPDGIAGWVQTFKNNTSNITGYQTSYDKATKQLDEVSRHFGLSFSDRKKLGKNNTTDPNQTRLFDQVLKELYR